MYKVTKWWEVGEYHIFQARMNHDDTTVYGFQIGDRKPSNELYATVDKAMVAAVGEKHTGHRGAGGTGVGTAADWFAKMIGLEPLDS